MVRILAVVLVFLLAGCTGRTDVAAERKAILQSDRDWAAAAAAKDVERVLSYWTDDAMVVPPGQPVVTGKPALRTFVVESFKIPGFSIQWETKDLTISQSGDLAIGYGTNRMTMMGPDKSLHTSEGRAFSVWRKEPGGVWKCALDIWNSGVPDSASPAEPGTE